MKKKNQDLAYLKTIIAVIIFIIMSILIFRTTNIGEKILISYNTESQIDYKVYLFENDYIKSDYMEKGKTYITDLVEKINLDYNYKISGSDEFDSTYKYDIFYKATIKHNSTGKELWTETVKLVDGKDVYVDENNNIIINENVDFIYKDLNTKIKNFRLQFNIPITAYVDVNLKLIDKQTNNSIDETGISIDLDTDVFEVKEVSTGKNIKNVTETKEQNNTSLVIEGIIAIGSLLYIFYTMYASLNNAFTRKSYYTKAVYKILKNYGDIVAEIIKPVDLNNYKVIDVKNFDQMLDVEEELRIPIMFYETIKNEEGWFVLIHNDIAYRYILKDRKKY